VVLDIRSFDFKGVTVGEPTEDIRIQLEGCNIEDQVPNVPVRSLELSTVFVDELLEDSVIVSQAVTEHGQVQRRTGIHITRRQTTQTAVSETGITLLVDQVFKAETESTHGLGDHVFHAQVENGVVQASAHEEFETEVVGSLGGLGGVIGGGVVPSSDQFVSDGKRASSVGTGVIQVERLSSQSSGLSGEIT
jgi:hypothetical protein